MHLTYELQHNQTSYFIRGWKPGDELAPGYRGTVEIPDDSDPSAMMAHACERIWVRHNADDRPDGQDAPSLSVGDVIVLGEVAFSVEAMGFSRVDLAG